MALNGLLIAIFKMVIVFKLSQKQLSSFIFLLAPFWWEFHSSFWILCLQIYLQWHWFRRSSLQLQKSWRYHFMMGYMLNRAHPNNLGQYASLYVLAFAGANVVGPLTGSMIADHYGFNFLWWCVFWIMYSHSIWLCTIIQTHINESSDFPEYRLNLFFAVEICCGRRFRQNPNLSDEGLMRNKLNVTSGYNRQKQNNHIKEKGRQPMTTFSI